ncbi:MAG: hypothetical protein GY715_00100 [Planctomycetes bacterium]|nr:hypothetical protein [Planctomycetota bacterium]
MTTDPRAHAADFTPTAYRAVLRATRERYRFSTFSDAPEAGRVYWRHDIDCCMDAACTLARIEADEGVVATYFLNMRSDFLNLHSASNRKLIRTVGSLGHELGLHFDGHAHAIASEADLVTALTADRTALEAITGTPIDAFSFHNPTGDMLAHEDDVIAGMTNAYAPRYFREIGYCSDSNGYWRHRRLLDVIESGAEPTLQVLTHPVFWVFDPPIPPKQRIWRTIEQHADLIKQQYSGATAAGARLNIGDDDAFDEAASLDPATADVIRNLHLLGHRRLVLGLLAGELRRRAHTLDEALPELCAATRRTLATTDRGHVPDADAYAAAVAELLGAMTEAGHAHRSLG